MYCKYDKKQNEEAEHTNRGYMDFAVKRILEAREKSWIYELQTVFPYDLNRRVESEFKIESMYINVASKFWSIRRKHSPANGGKITKDRDFFYHYKL